MKYVLLFLLGVLICCGGVVVLGVSLIQLVDKGYTHPLVLLGLVFNVIAGLTTAVVGFIYVWECLYRM